MPKSCTASSAAVVPAVTLVSVARAQTALLPAASGPMKDIEALTVALPMSSIEAPPAEYHRTTVSPGASVTESAPSCDASPLTKSCQYLPVSWSHPSTRPSEDVMSDR